MKHIDISQRWVVYERTWLGKVLPSRLHGFLPHDWVGKWVPGLIVNGARS
jgi:hypothetical protein